MIKKLILTAWMIPGLIQTNSYAQPGCMDIQATNYNPSATSNDGSCLYSSTNLGLTFKANLATPVLDETSGLAFIANKLWTHNDSGNSNTLFRVDSANGSVLQSVTVTNATNVDWEDIAAGPQYVYVGDFGNNNGNRTDLKIYRIAISALTPAATSVSADIINFSFSDQTSFVSAPNNNDFDCESVIFYNDSLHLFSKNWVNKQCRHYVLPAVPGTWVAQVKESFNTASLITGACIQEGGVLALLGYDKSGLFPVSLWMMYDYHGGLFFNGNKRKFSLSTMLVNGQTEGIDFKNGAYGYISNERLQQNPFNIAPAIKSFDLSPYLPASFVYPPPLASFSANDQSVCKYKNVTFMDQSLHQPLTWNWTFPGGTPSSSTLQHPVVTYNTPGSYAVTLIAGNAYGSDTLTLNNYMTVASLPSVTLTANGPLNFCTGGSVLLTAGSPAAIAWQWKKNGNILPGATSSVYMATKTGTYKVIVTNSAGCQKSSSSLSVTGPPTASFSADGPLAFCTGDSVGFTATNGNGYSFQWKKNGSAIPLATGQSYSAKNSGIYKVVVTNSYGCSKSSNTKTVTINCRENDPVMNRDLHVFPDPADQYLVVQGIRPGDDFVLYDCSGRRVKPDMDLGEEHASGSCLLNLISLQPGVYFIRVVDDRNAFTVRFVKM